MADAGAVRAGRAFVELGVEGLQKVQAQMDVFANTIAAIGGALSLNFAVGKLTGWVSEFAEGGRQIHLMSRQLQMTTDEYQEMAMVARELGIETNTMGESIQAMRQYFAQMGRAGEQTNDTMNRLGLTLNDLAGKSDLSRLQLITERMRRLGRDETSLIGRQILGGGGVALAAAAGDLGHARDVAAAGPKQTREQIQIAYELSQQMHVLESAKEGVFKAIGDALSPLFRSVTDAVIPLVTQLRDFIIVNKTVILQIASAAAPFVAAGTAMLGLAAAYSIGSMVVGSFASAIGGMAGLVASATRAVWMIISPVRIWNALHAIGTGIMYGFRAAIVAVRSAIIALTTTTMIMDGIKTAFAAILNPMTLLPAAIGAVAVAAAGLGIYFLATSEAGQRLFAAIGEGAVNLKTTVVDAFGGISDALEAGDLGLAWEVLMAGMKVAWYQFNDILQKALGFDLIEAFYGIRYVWADITSALSRAWVETIAFFKTTWLAASASIQQTGESIGTSIGNHWARIWGRMQGMSDDVIDMTIDQSNREQAASNRRIQDQLAQDVGNVERRRTEGRNNIAAELQRVRDEIAAAAANRGNDAIGAQIELQNAIEAASIARAQREAERLGEVPNGLDDFMKRGAAARGTFNRDAISGLGGGPLVQLGQQQVQRLDEIRLRLEVLDKTVDGLQLRVV